MFQLSQKRSVGELESIADEIAQREGGIQMIGSLAEARWTCREAGYLAELKLGADMVDLLIERDLRFRLGEIEGSLADLKREGVLVDTPLAFNPYASKWTYKLFGPEGFYSTREWIAVENDPRFKLMTRGGFGSDSVTCAMLRVVKDSLEGRAFSFRGEDETPAPLLSPAVSGTFLLIDEEESRFRQFGFIHQDRTPPIDTMAQLHSDARAVIRQLSDR